MRIERVAFVAALARKDLTITELAALSGVSRATISAIKSGKRCSKKTAEKLIAILGTDIIEKEV